MSISARCGILALGIPVLVVLSGCGLFSVADSDMPIAGSQNDDPLGFSGLLEGTGEQFDRVGYEELFAGNFTYREGISQSYTKSQFITRLRTIERLNPDTIPAIEWTRDPGKLPIFSRVSGFSVLLDSMTYRVYLTGAPSQLADYTGYADIGLVYSSGYWSITYWYDFPVLQATGRSFFSPEFAQ